LQGELIIEILNLTAPIIRDDAIPLIEPVLNNTYLIQLAKLTGARTELNRITAV
jgi:hypothetical protein